MPETRTLTSATSVESSTSTQSTATVQEDISKDDSHATVRPALSEV